MDATSYNGACLASCLRHFAQIQQRWHSDTLKIDEITKTNVNIKDARYCINMTEIRTAIDIIDNQIIELIGSRSKYVKDEIF